MLKKNIMGEINVPALKVEFTQKLINLWYEDYQGLTIADFLDGIAAEFEGLKDEYIVPGDTGVYIDDEVVFQLNCRSAAGREKYTWDKDSSVLIFGTEKQCGIYSKDADGNKIPLNSVQASDIRIWNCLALFILREYNKRRWGDKSNANRLFIKSLSNGNVSRHSIMRLYWSARICYDRARVNKLELLNTLWKSEDFMTQVTERSTAGMADQIRFFLDFCSQDKNKGVFTEKSFEGYLKYRKVIKLLLADSNVLSLTMLNKDEMHLLLDQNLEASA